MTSTCRRIALGLTLAMFLPVLASAQNTTPPNAVGLFPGQQVHYFLNGATPERWYVLWLPTSRSYCAEVGTGTTEGEYYVLDPEVTVYRDNHTTVIKTNDDATDPAGYLGSRACWIQTGADGNFPYIKVFSHTTLGVSRWFTLRVVETTLWCPWFFIDGDYNAFTLLRNTTNVAVPLLVIWRNAAGAQVGTFSGSIPADGNLSLNARTYVAGAVSGSIDIVHSGSPDAIQGSTTTLSGTTGVGFDATFAQRRPW